VKQVGNAKKIQLIPALVKGTPSLYLAHSAFLYFLFLKEILLYRRKDTDCSTSRRLHCYELLNVSCQTQP
jgi:hypothetical protein